MRPNPTATPTPPPRPAPVTIDATPVAAPPKLAPAQPVPGEQPTVLQASQPTSTGVDLSAPSQLMTPEQNNMFAQMKPQVDTLVQLAKDGQDAAAVADMFFDQYLLSVDDATYESMCELFEDPKTIGRMALFNKGVNEHKAWFETLQLTLINKIKQEVAAATVQNVEPDASNG
jgi:hypothetical protein